MKNCKHCGKGAIHDDNAKKCVICGGTEFEHNEFATKQLEQNQSNNLNSNINNTKIGVGILICIAIAMVCVVIYFIANGFSFTNHKNGICDYCDNFAEHKLGNEEFCDDHYIDRMGDIIEWSSEKNK